MASTSAQTQETPKSDPVVLGVSVPLNVTLTAVKQVADAWQKFGMDFAQAVAHIRDSKANSKSAKEPPAESSAAAAAGVNA
jgi:hypothetical protein